MDLGLSAAGLFVGIVVGLTGMGGGALMTPVLVLFFGVPPLAAVSSDLVASAFMKPIGGAVHLRNGTVNTGLAKLLIIGSVPSAFAGVFVLKAFGDGAAVQSAVKTALGVALLIAAVSLALKAYIALSKRARRVAEGLPAPGRAGGPPQIVLRPVATIVVGVLGGLIVGMTSVGSGSLIIIALLALYPTLNANQLVGTDLVQAVPLVASAALGHYFFGDFRLDVTGALLLGAIPGVYLGAKMSSRAPGAIIRRALTLVLVASGLKLLDVDTVVLGYVLLGCCIVAPLVWAGLRRRSGLPAFARQERAARAAAAAGLASAVAGPEPVTAGPPPQRSGDDLPAVPAGQGADAGSTQGADEDRVHS